MNERFMCLGHGSVILAQEASLGETFRNFVAVNIGERLQDLDAAAMAVHVAEAADVHEDVKAQALPGGEFAQQFVVAAAVARAQGDDLVAACFFKRPDVARNLTIRVVAGAVEQGGGEINFERLVLHQVDRSGRVSMGAFFISSDGGLG